VKGLRRLGLDEAVIALGSVLERAVTMTPEGDVLDTTPIGELSRRAGAPSVCVHRADLQGCLMRAVPPERLHTGSECAGFEPDDHGVTARFADGGTERGDLLIGADGIHSAVRRQLHGPAEPRYAGYSAWRGIAETGHPDLPADGSVLALGPGMQVGLFPCGPGRVYWFATRNEPAGEPDEPGRRKAEILAAVRGWWPPIPAVVEATPEAAVLKNAVLDRPPVRRWGMGRVTFVGDAIHPTTPNLGQGACQALEDAVALADALRHGGDVVAGLRDYERRRRDRTAMVVRRSRSLGRVLQWEHPALVRLRAALSRTTPAHHQGIRLFEELLGHEPPELPPTANG
jgi:2-polyprenyl-6-methoxyphenol hydroxylase-like FAD-dependent oxidoreductase